MRINHTLDKSFGPTASFAGLILVFVGIILLPFYWTGAILIVIGALIGFTVSGCEIDADTKLVRQYHMYFGVFKSGSWQRLDKYTSIRVVKTRNSYRTFSLSNRATVNTQEDFRVVLEAGNPQSRLEVMKSKSREEAMEEAQQLSNILGIELLDT